MLNLLRGAALCALLSLPFGATLAQESDDDAQAFVRTFEASLNKRTGNIALPGKVATLHVPESYYYLSPSDAERVLVDVWGNPPGSGSTGLGMIFPADGGPFSEGSWGATIDFIDDGYVSDEDAAKIDYDDLLAEMQDSVREESKQRVKAGFDAIDLVGWASPPFYDPDSHKLHWAKEIKFGDSDAHTLNYDIRALGRKGVLEINFVAGIDQKALIDSKLDEVLAMAEFDAGSRYEDFDPGIDKIAAYGIGALVAGKLAAKAGLLTAGLLFLKKFGILLVAGIAALWRKLTGKKAEQAGGG